MVGHVSIAFAFGQDFEISLDEGDSAAEEKGDLSGLHLLASELGAAREGRQIVGDRFGRVVHDLADLRSGLALECKADDLSAMREDWSKIVERTAHRDQDVGLSLADHFQVTRDGSRGDEEDAIGQVFGGEQGSLTKGLLAKVEDSSLAKASRTVLKKQEVVDLAAMEGEADGLLLTVSDGLSRRLVRGDGDKGDLPWGRLRGLGGEEGKVDLFDDAEHGLRLEGRTVQSLLTPIADSEPLAIVSREPLLESGLGVFFKRALNKAVFLFVLVRRNALDYRYASGWRFDHARGER